MVKARRAWKDAQTRCITLLKWSTTVSMESTVSTRMRSSHAPRRHSLRLAGSPSAAWKAVSLQGRLRARSLRPFLLAPPEPDGILSHHPALQFPSPCVQDRFGSSHHAYLCVLSVGKPASLRRWASLSPLCPCRRLSRPLTIMEAPLPWGSRPVGNPTLYPCCTSQDSLGVPFVPL
jgi:hypothetical protein